jgi:nucleotide-binding universal stress UspA family protein
VYQLDCPEGPVPLKTPNRGTTEDGVKMYKDILVHLDESHQSGTRLKVAVDLARRNAAHLTGIWVIDVPGYAMFYGAGMPAADGGMNEVVASLRSDAIARADAAGADFREAMRREGLSCEWRKVEGDGVGLLALHARYADLTILGQPNEDEAFKGPSVDAVLVNVLLSSGRPVLAVPYVGQFERVGDRVMIAWDGSREATRALNDALPLLRGATAVTVLSVNPKHGINGDGDVPAADIALHLARHGVKAEAAHTIAQDIGEGDALLSYAADLGADLIVSGGYGHSRAREMIFGGVTRTLIEEMTVPMLLSH